MARLRLNPAHNHPTFIREWRKHRGLTLERLADRIGVSTGALSQLERGDVGYTQPMLEALAEALSCEPADLITYSPKAVEDLRRIWAGIPEERQEQALKVLQAFMRDGTSG
jgi:transcriptional regulator with XRE-family HTH domain